MSTDLVVRARQARDLTTARLRTLLSSIGQEAGLRLSLVGEAVGIRVTLALAPDHADAFELLLARVGARLTLTTRDPRVPVALWLAHRLAAQVRGTVFDPQRGEDSTESPALEAVKAIVAAHEREVPQHSKAPAGEGVGYDAEDLEILLAALVDAEAIDVQDTSDARLSTLVPLLGDPVVLYQALLDHPAVDEVFIEDTAFYEAWKRLMA
ncbi:MAG TPA: hypothetical protein PLB92_12445, partial [Rhodoglobus sp.]|jgi:hypothetical protein|nr:hypothetical protein [Rhodoglobus sp.]